MAEEEAKEGEENKEAAAPKGSKKKLFIIIGAVVLLLVAIGVPVTFMAMKPKDKHEEDLSQVAAHPSEDLVAEGNADEDELEEGEEALGALFPMESFVVNLSGGKFIRLQVQLEFQEREVPKRFYAKLVPVRDSIISLLTGRTPQDLEGQKGKESLKHDIKESINEMLRKEEVRNVYFTQFLVQ